MDIADLQKLAELKAQRQAQRELQRRELDNQMRQPIAPADLPSDFCDESGHLDSNRLGVASPRWGAATAIAAIHGGAGVLRGDVDLVGEAAALLTQLKRHDEGLADGTGHLEAILSSQIEVLNALFTKLVIKSAAHLDYESGQATLALAVSVQKQCAKTIATLNELKNPKRVQFIKQQQNLLQLEANNHAQMDSGSQRTTAESDRTVEAVVEVNWAKDGGGEDG